MTIHIAAYSKILAGEDQQIQNLTLHIRTNSPGLRETFARAVAGEHVVDNALAASVTGNPATVYFNRFDTDTSTLDYKNFTAPIAELEIERAKTKTLSPEQEQELEEGYNVLAGVTGYDPGFMRSLFKNLLHSVDAKTEDSAGRLSRMVNKELVESKDSAGAAHAGDDGRGYFILPRYESEERFLKYGTVNDTNDLPPRKPPFSKETREFLTALHEFEHEASDAVAETPIQVGSFLEDAPLLPSEIDADAGVLNFLRENGMADARSYLQSERMVDSFKSGLVHQFNHDTATFLRVLEHSGRQLDLGKFLHEKKELMDMTAKELGLPADQKERVALLDKMGDEGRYPKVSQMMGAITTLLQRDAEQVHLRDNAEDYNSREILSDVQRAEAQSFLEDAAALGYKADPDYKITPPALAAEQKAQPSVPIV